VNEPDREVVALLRELRDGQRATLELQREHMALAREEFERAQRLHERAERLQDRSAAILSTARRTLAVVLPLVLALIVYLSWLLLR
jgi:predicted O-methyltransferase YrrM